MMYRECVDTCPMVISLVEQNKAYEEENSILQMKVTSLEERLIRVHEERDEAQAKVEVLEGEVRKRTHEIFGRKSEKDSTSSLPDDKGDGTDEEKPKRSRGAEPGHKGHGRIMHEVLEERVIHHELPLEERTCPDCGSPMEDMGATEDSVEYDVKIRYIKCIHKRHKYRRMCSCEKSPIVTVPTPPKLIPRGKYSVSFWTQVLFDRFVLNLPYTRQLLLMKSHGLRVPASTLLGGMERILEYLLPLYMLLIDICKEASRWQMDETSWPVFVDKGEKKTHNWWMWTFSTDMAVTYIIDPSRSSAVPIALLEGRTGILSADRYSAYKTLLKKVLGIIIAFCWSHQRRDFVNLKIEFKAGHRIHAWAKAWVERIGQVYHLDNLRHQHQVGSEAFIEITEKLRKVLSGLRGEAERELKETDELHDKQIKALESLTRHWSGLTIFVDHPEVPIDNNVSERMIRPLAVSRKNSYGSHSEWGAALVAVVCSILQTCMLHNVEPRTFLELYLGACAECGGVPENLEEFLPWRTPLFKRNCRGRDP